MNDSTGLALASASRRWHIGAVRLSLLLVLAACHGDMASGSADGAAIFQAVCAACHGPTGKPAYAMVARLGVKDLTAPALRDKLTPEHVAQQIRDGSQNKLMPAFAGALTEAQI